MNPLINPIVASLTPAQETANLLCQMPANIFAIWDNGVRTVWANHRGLAPQDIFDALGTNGGPLLAASEALVSALEAQAPGCTAATMALVQPVTIDANGNVTVTAPSTNDAPPETSSGAPV